MGLDLFRANRAIVQGNEMGTSELPTIRPESQKDPPVFELGDRGGLIATTGIQIGILHDSIVIS